MDSVKITHGAIELARAVQDVYKRGQTDYSFKPMIRRDKNGDPIGRIQDGDSVIFACRRGEREIEITEAFTDPAFNHFERPFLNDLHFVILTMYHEKFKDLPVAFAPSSVSQTLGEVISKAGYSLFIAASQYDSLREQNIVQAMMEQRTDGVIICSSSFSADKGRQLLANKFPIVVVNYKANENFNYSIYHDDVDGSQQITSYLVQLGHKKIAYFGNSKSGRTSQDRLIGFQKEMKNAGLDIPSEYVFEVEGSEPAMGKIGLEYFQKLSHPPTAIMCFNDMLAVGLLRACKIAGIKVPEDLSITGFDNITFSAYTNPSLTTLDQPKYSIGNEAAQLLLDLLKNLENSDNTHKEKILKGSLLIRESTTIPKTQI